MGSSPTETADPPRPARYLTDDQALVKVVITGGLGVGKTTMIDAVSEIPPAHTEAVMTKASLAVDDLDATPDKHTTTVVMDFGRRTLHPGDIVLYLFGSGGQKRFLEQWEDLTRGAAGALVLVDTRRLDSSFEALDLAERSALPYVVAVNAFPDSPAIPEETLRDHLDLDPATPLLDCRAPDFHSSMDALIALFRHVIDSRRTSEDAS